VWATAAAARAGVCGFFEHPFMVDTAGEPMRVARAPWLQVDLQGVERYCELLFPAMEEALEFIRQQLRAQGRRAGLTLAFPSQRPGRVPQLADGVLGALDQRFEGVFTHQVTFETGHAAGYGALDAAVRAVRGGLVDVCMVGGVDSYVSPETLDWLEACDQLNGAGSANNAWGFIPGEAAGALVIASREVATALNAPTYGDLISVGLGREIKLIKSDDVCVGEGLTEAFRGAFEGLTPAQSIHNVVCDLNGETYRADEYGFAALRMRDRFRSVTEFVAPADCWGDVGAAGAPLHAALCLIANRKCYGKGPLSLICASSETGERGAAILRGSNTETI
jgi:3-oxoacyl-[acyl-carrier-protein] synthase-1